MDFIERTSQIPSDGRHRWVYAMTPAPYTVDVITERYHRAGFDTALVTQTTAAFRVSDKHYYVYAALAENTIPSLTPASASTPETIFAVSLAPVSETLERALDINEWVVDGKAHPFKIGKSTDKLRDNAYYTCEAFYSKGSASIVSIKDKLTGEGYDVAFWPGEVDRQRTPGVNSVRFALATQEHAPLISDLQKLLGADFLIVNMFPLTQSAWIGFKNMDPQRTGELIALVASIGDTMRGSVTGLLELGREAFEKTSWLPTILKFAVPVAAVLGGLWLYRTFRRRPQE